MALDTLTLDEHLAGESHLPTNVLVPTSRGRNAVATSDGRGSGGEEGKADVTVAHTAKGGPGDVTLWGGALGDYTDLWSWRDGASQIGNRNGVRGGQRAMRLGQRTQAWG